LTQICDKQRYFEQLESKLQQLETKFEHFDVINTQQLKEQQQQQELQELRETIRLSPDLIRLLQFVPVKFTKELQAILDQNAESMSGYGHYPFIHFEFDNVPNIRNSCYHWFNSD
jgi:vacuolar-type H+-ATPase subunit I/STV1